MTTRLFLELAVLTPKSRLIGTEADEKMEVGLSAQELTFSRKTSVRSQFFLQLVRKSEDFYDRDRRRLSDVLVTEHIRLPYLLTFPNLLF